MNVTPYRCPRNHANVEVGRNRCWCQTCRQNGYESAAFDKCELVDLRGRQ